jgi:hypothetical protein
VNLQGGTSMFLTERNSSEHHVTRSERDALEST